MSDTGPLITWPRSNRLPLLLEVYADIVVPQAVAEELVDPRRLFRPGHDLLERGWIRKHELSIPRDPTLPRGFGAGEREAIDLARQMNSMLLIGVASRNGNNCTLRVLSRLPQRSETAVLDLFTLAPNVVPRQVDVLPAQR